MKKSKWKRSGEKKGKESRTFLNRIIMLTMGKR